jgi:hypothetical protein
MSPETIPSPQDILQSARRQILLQHATLRGHLFIALDHARAAARGDASRAGELPGAIILLLAELESHMAYEESALLPVLVHSGAEGREKAASIEWEHRRQRQEFATMLDLARGKVDNTDLALTLQSLVADVLMDMVDEEDKLARVAVTDSPTPATLDARAFFD